MRSTRRRSGALILAEGIETEDHLRRAPALGASYGQGRLFGRPGALESEPEAAATRPWPRTRPWWRRSGSAGTANRHRACAAFTSTPTSRCGGEWNVTVLGPHFGAAFVSPDLGDDGPDHERRFDFAMTHDREPVTEVARSMMRGLAA